MSNDNVVELQKTTTFIAAIHFVQDAQRVRIYGADITERKQASEALLKAYAENDGLVKSLAHRHSGGRRNDLNRRYWNIYESNTLGKATGELAPKGHAKRSYMTAG